MKPIEFWYSIGSTYSYLTVMRLDDVARQTGVEFRWRPYNVRRVMIEQKNIPFADKPVKSAYMWRDIERRAARYHLPVKVPAPYPLDDLALANQVAVLGMQDGWGLAYSVETYRLWFQQGLPSGSEPNLSQSLRAIGQDPAATLAMARSPAIEHALDRQTDMALAKGVFGAPSFVVGDEVFWGDDRLEDAITWARHGHLG